MKITVWVVATCIPERGEKPCMPNVFGTEAEAEAYADQMLRAEWETNGVDDFETGESLPYPGDWREANDLIAAEYDDGSWGEWEITSHEIEIGSLAVILDGGLVQGIVTTGRTMVGADVAVIDYDTEGGDSDGVTEIDQGDGTVADAYVSGWSVSESAIVVPSEAVATPITGR